MPGATFSRLKNWTTEVLTNTDLNLEIDNILNNLGPAGVDDYSASAAQMKLQTSPGGLGSESLPTSLAGEIERLRYVIRRLMGSSTTYWYESPPTSLSDIANSLGAVGLPPNRIISGLSRTSSSTLVALVPAGTAASVALKGSVTPFVYQINNVPYSITTDVTVASLLTSSTAATVRLITPDAGGFGQVPGLSNGMYETNILATAASTAVISLAGSIASFKINTEHFLATIAASSTTATATLTAAWRGCFFDSNSSPIVSEDLTASGATISMTKLVWIYAKTDLSLAVAYTNPTISGTQPSAPATGDYWFDLNQTTWKTFNSVSWQTANATLIGIAASNATACVAARTFDVHRVALDLNTLHIVRTSANSGIAQATEMNGRVSIFGTVNDFRMSRPLWDLSRDLDAGTTIAVNRPYFLYMKESGIGAISMIPPLVRQDVGGLYHPHNMWRCLAKANVTTDNATFTAFQSPIVNITGSPSGIMFMDNPMLYNQSAMGTSFDPASNGNFCDVYLRSAVNVGQSLTGAIGASGTWGEIATVACGAGLWRFEGLVTIVNTGVTALATQWALAISDAAAGASPTGAGIMYAPLTAATGDRSSLWAFNVLACLRGDSKIYLKSFINAVSSTATKLESGYLRAYRIDAITGVPT